MLLSNTKGDFLMNDLVVKSVDLFGDSVMAAKDKDGTIWVGVNSFCHGLDRKSTRLNSSH